MRRNNNMKPYKFSDNVSFVRSFESLFENAEDPSFLLDTSGIVVTVNRRILVMGKFKKKDLIGKTLKEIVRTKIWSNAAPAVKNAVKGKPARFELDFTSTAKKTYRLEVTLVPCISYKKIIGILGIVRDVTKRKEVEGKLRSSETKLRTLFENMPNGVLCLNQKGSYLRNRVTENN